MMPSGAQQNTCDRADADIRLTRGVWKLSLVLAPGQWGRTRLQERGSGGKVGFPIDSAQDIIVVTYRPLQLGQLPDALLEGACIVSEKMPFFKGVGAYVGALTRQVSIWPRATLAATVRQFFSSGLFAIPAERSTVPCAGAAHWPETGFEVELEPGQELLDGAMQRLAQAFRAPQVKAVSWDIAHDPNGILPGPMRVLQAVTGYASRGWAHRGKGTLQLQDLDPGEWLHLHEPLSRQTERAPIPPAAQAAPGKAATCSVIIPTRDRADLLAACLEGLRQSMPTPFEIILVDHLTQAPDALAILDAAEKQGATRIKADGAFNFSRLVNLGAARATGQVLVFLNNDVTPIGAGWLDSLSALAVRDDVGVVGAELRYPDGSLQHAGMANMPDAGPQHVCVGWSPERRGPFRMLDHVRETLAVSGACLATRREVFERLGGFDEGFPEDYNDVDYCLRAREAGLLTLMAPGAKLTHRESATRATGRGEAEARRLAYLDALRTRHACLQQADPYFSPRWSIAPPAFRPARWGG